MSERDDAQKVMRYDAERIVDEVIQERVDKAIYQLIGKRVKEATESLYDYVDNVVADIKTPNSPRGEVRYFGGSLIHNRQDSSSIDFLQSGTGAIASNVQSELRRLCFTPQQFGGIGDGTADDTTAVNAAVTAASTLGGVVFFPPATSYFCKTLNGASNVWFLGYAATIKLHDDGTSASNTLHLNTVNDIVVEGLTFDSDATGRTGVYGLIRAEACNRVRILKCKFLTSPSTAIYVANCNDVDILNNQVGDGTKFTYADGIHINRQSSRVRIAGNIVRKSQDDGIGIPSNKDSGTYTANTDILVEGNIVDTNVTLGNGISVTGGTRVTVRNNIVKNSINSGILASMAGDATYNSGTDLTIIGNVIQSPAQFGISVGGLTRGIVANNIVLDNGAGITDSGIQLVSTTVDVSVNGNLIKGATDYGIYEEAGSGPNTFVGNTLVSNTTGPMLINGATGSKISHNVGFVSTNTGSSAIASGTTSVTITHGLNKTPDASGIFVTPTLLSTSDPGEIYVDTITSTQFTVHCRTNPGVSGLNFNWRATVE